MWTEAWTGWLVPSLSTNSLSFFDCTMILIVVFISRFEEFGGPIHRRPVEDIAFAVARFIQKGGSFVNYYMVVKFNSSVLL